MTAAAIRGDWVGQTLEGKFPLLKWLGGSGTCGTFLTELDGPGSHKATLKLFSAPAQAEDRLTVWQAIVDLSHVHLARILHFGRAEVNGTPLVYVITEYAEEVLAEIIPERPLTADESRAMLEPVLDALSYIHTKGFVHGHLKPSNVLVIENEVKLSADGLIMAGTQALDVSSGDVHNAPESAVKAIEPSADIWSLGITVVEALTQQAPVWDAAGKADPAIPSSLPRPFAEIARASLRMDPLRRCSLDDVRALLEARSKPLAPPIPPAIDRAAEELATPQTQSRMPIVPLIVGLALLLAIAIGLALRSHKTTTVPMQTEATRQAPPAEPESKAVAPAPAASEAANVSSTAGSTTKGEVANRDVPDVPSGASSTIQGKVTVAVRVNVDPSGAVTNAEFSTHGPSAYFARLAMESARKWSFKPPQSNGRAMASTWMLRYQFRRSGADVSSVETTP